ncbi:protein-L-isoaspartate(D-aspartate) O-methyltransferase [Candidatus Pacearchaeota archaeon]|nr:protein-L-isoaspartate(D-aspartate) O-methyltransferase [Candidatus Pacearchaeota archaeon]
MNKTQLLEHLKIVGFSSKILDAFSTVGREEFISSELEPQAYEDTALPIGNGQTISQPYTIALMLSELDLKKGQKVLEIGSGSGYVLALISSILGRSGKVFGLEIISKLVKKSKKNLVGYKNTRVYNKNGSLGLPEEAPFDRILISAAVREIPKALLEQLKDNGILIAPIGPRFEQKITVFQKKNKEIIKKSEIPGFIFVPFVENSEEQTSE